MIDENPTFRNLAQQPPEWGHRITQDRLARLSWPTQPRAPGPVGAREGGRRRAATARLLSPTEYAEDVTPGAIVEGLVFESSTTLLTGVSKGGKSMLAAQLAASVATGVRFLGCATTQCPVLYVSLEMAAAMVRSRFEAIERDVGLPAPRIGRGFALVAPTARDAPAIDLGTEDGAATLRQLIRESEAKLAVLDTLYRFLPGLDPNDNGQMGLAFGRLNEIAQETGCGLLPVDHAAKGEHQGPVSHSALGASVKGGAARVIAQLRRTQREDGGRWRLDVESHFGSWDEPLYYERPLRPDGTRGSGCVLCTASEAHGLDEATVRRIFEQHGEPDRTGRPVIPSKTRLRAALIAEGCSSGNAQADAMVASIVRDYCRPEGADWGQDRPIVTIEGPRKAIVFTWRMATPR
jgi:hypothetical protein